MKYKNRKTTGVKGSGSEHSAENITDINANKQIFLKTKKDALNSVIEGENMDSQNKKTTGVKGTGSGKSPENISGETNNIQTEIKKEDSIPEIMFFDFDNNIEELYFELHEESLKDSPREISINVINAGELLFDEIKALSDLINEDELKVNFIAKRNIDFVELSLIAICVTGEVNFPNKTYIHMESDYSIPKEELYIISKKISEKTGVEADFVSISYYMEAVVKPWQIFLDKTNALYDSGSEVYDKSSEYENIILINEDSDLDQIGKDLITESNIDSTKKKMLIIGQAKTLKLSKIEKLGSIIKNIPIKVLTFASEDMNMVEMAMFILFRNDGFLISGDIEIIMETLEPLSENELNRFSEIIANDFGKDVEDIKEHYRNKNTINLTEIIEEKNKNK